MVIYITLLILSSLFETQKAGKYFDHVLIEITAYTGCNVLTKLAKKLPP